MTFVGVFTVVAARDRRVGAARGDDPCAMGVILGVASEAHLGG
jgi:hypothetical protein